MVKTYFDTSLVNGKKYCLNNYRIKKIRDKILLTTDHGAWVLLEKKEYDSLIRFELSDDLFEVLEEKGIIFTLKNSQTIANLLSQRLHYLFNGASLHIIIPTLKCNHCCVYCHSASKKKESVGYDLNQETAKEIINFILQSPAKTITIEFQGGESLLNFDIVKFIVTQAKISNLKTRKNLRFTIVTNLTLLTDTTLHFLKEHKVRICTSLDGPAHIHDKNRIIDDGGESYAIVSRQLERLKNEGIIPGALMVTTRYSLENWKEIIDEYVKWGFLSIQIKYINKIGFAQDTWEKIGYTIDEFIEFWKKSVDYMIELNKKGIRVRERFVDLILKKILGTRDPSFLDFRSPCGAVIGQIAYNYNGDIHCCDEGRSSELFRLGNVKTDTYTEIITSKQAQQLVSSSINDSYLCDNCVYKPYCGVCPVMNYSEDGNIIPKLANNSKCKLQKAQFDYVFDKILFDEEAREIFFGWISDEKYGVNEHTHEIENER